MTNAQFVMTSPSGSRVIVSQPNLLLKARSFGYTNYPTIADLVRAKLARRIINRLTGSRRRKTRRTRKTRRSRRTRRARRASRRSRRSRR